jgi:hypothetical protein
MFTLTLINKPTIHIIMEKIQSLINKLQQQSASGQQPAAMMVTVQLLQMELQQLIGNENNHQGTANVAVVFPGYNNTAKIATVVATNGSHPHKENIITETTKQSVIKNPEKVVPKQKEETDYKINSTAANPWAFDNMGEVPTLAHQKQVREVREINEAISHGNSITASLNEFLKTNKPEVADTLTDGPVRDLKKAIGINDRFVFINELFRGDETMYERSIKTINNFRILPEAEYWMQRELKLKLAWQDDNAAALHFYQLVKRRFS